MIKKTTYLKKEMIIQEIDDEFLVPSEEESGLMYYFETNSGLIVDFVLVQLLLLENFVNTNVLFINILVLSLNIVQL